MKRLSFSTALVCGAILLRYKLQIQRYSLSLVWRRFVKQLLMYQSICYGLICGYSRFPAFQPRAKKVVVGKGRRLGLGQGGEIRAGHDKRRGVTKITN